MISGPSGTGKGTLRRRLFQTVPGLAFSISCTTRPPRRDERHGEDYRFLDNREFDRLIREGAFLEWAEVHGNRYGTLASDVEEERRRGRDVVLEIDVQGACAVKSRYPEAVLIFVFPPSQQDLRERLQQRGTESESDLKVRLTNAETEIRQAGFFDHTIVNDDVEGAAQRLQNLVREYRKRRTTDTGGNAE